MVYDQEMIAPHAPDSTRADARLGHELPGRVVITDVDPEIEDGPVQSDGRLRGLR